MAIGRLLYIYFIFLLLCGCVEPFNPEIESTDKFLVVDGLITNESIPNKITLTYSKNDKSIPTEKVSNARVSILLDDNKEITLREAIKGEYTTDPTSFQGEIGEIYTLKIITTEGKEYRSEPCEMYSVPEIDSIFFYYSLGYSNLGNDQYRGLTIVSRTNLTDVETNLRWTFKESWKFAVPYPAHTSLYVINDSTLGGEALPTKLHEFCWKNNSSNNIIIERRNPSFSEIDKEINFITNYTSDRLSSRYSILIKQYSISDTEYSFWNQLQQSSEPNIDIFGYQPNSVLSNLRNVADPNEQVLGYFQVSAVTSQVFYINNDDVDWEYLDRAPSNSCELESFNSIYPPGVDSISVGEHLTYIYDQGYLVSLYDMMAGQYLFSKAECVDCRVTGNPTPPNYWIDR